MDLSFFVFTLPGLRFVVSFLMAVVVLSHDRRPGHALPLRRHPDRWSRAAHHPRPRACSSSVLAALLLLLIAANYWLDRYSLLTQSGSSDRFQGASYADVNAVIPSKAILAAIAVFVALLFVVNAVRGNWRIPAIGVGLMVVAAIAIGGIYPPSSSGSRWSRTRRSSRASTSSATSTRRKTAFGLDDVEVTPYSATHRRRARRAARGRRDGREHPPARPDDRQPVVPPAAAEQAVLRLPGHARRGPLRRRRREPGHRDRGPRAQPRRASAQGQRTWVNDHTVYTHGFGVVAAYGNTTSDDGQPAFYEGGIPPVGELGDYEPRIYFGQESPDTTRSSARPRRRTRGSSTTRTTRRAARSTTPSRPTRSTPARASATSSTSCCTR